MQPRHLPQQLLEQLVAHLLGARQLERLDVGLARDQQRVALGAEAGRDHFGHAHAGLRGHQRRQRLVLDLLEPSDGRAPRRVAVGEQPPATRQPLGVLRVSTEHAHLQRRPRPRRARQYSAAPIRCRSAIRRSLTSTPSDASAPRTRVDGRHAGCGSEREPDERAGAETEREPAEDVWTGGAIPERDTSERRQRRRARPRRTRTGRTSSGPATAITATTHARRSSGNPQRDRGSASSGSQSESTMRARTLAPAVREAVR